MLRITTWDTAIEALMLHPRKSNRELCQRCLCVSHFRKDCVTANPEKTSANFTLKVTAPATVRAILSPYAEGWTKAVDIFRKRVAPGLKDRLRREAAGRAAAARRKSGVHKRVVDARVEAKAAVTAELNVIRRLKTKGGDKEDGSGQDG